MGTRWLRLPRRRWPIRWRSPVWARLEALPDPRSPRGVIYPLACLMAAAVCAMSAARHDRKLTSYFTSGRPVLAAVGSDGATARELARTGGAALVLPPGDPTAFVAGVRALQADVPLRDRMATAGRHYA